MRRAPICLGSVLLLAASVTVDVRGQSNEAQDAAVMEALDAFLAGFNSRDPETFAAALHFPHVILDGSRIIQFEAKEDYVARDSALWGSVQDNWARTVWDDRRIVQRLGDTVHVAGRWARLDAAGNVIAKADVLYTVTRKDGRWAIFARSGNRRAQGALREP